MFCCHSLVGVILLWSRQFVPSGDTLHWVGRSSYTTALGQHRLFEELILMNKLSIKFLFTVSRLITQQISAEICSSRSERISQANLWSAGHHDQHRNSHSKQFTGENVTHHILQERRKRHSKHFTGEEKKSLKSF